MNAIRRVEADRVTYLWPLVLCLVGVDYFSTLAYLPSIAVQAAGPLAPVAAGGVILVTFLLALPVYWYVVGRAPDGRGATGLLETLVQGWRGKILVLAMLGFAAADFVITRSLSLAVAAVHVIHNPHGQQWIKRLPDNLLLDGRTWWPPLEDALRLAVEPQMFITLALSVFSFGLWYFLRHGFTRRVVVVTTAAVAIYLVLVTVVVGESLMTLSSRPDVYQAWWQSLFHDATNRSSSSAWYWSWFSIGLWSFPQMALGLSGFEMIMTMAPRVRGGRGRRGRDGRIRNTRRLMLAAVLVMAVYMLGAVLVTTLLVPHQELLEGGAAEHRALAYLAHGSTLFDSTQGTIVQPEFADAFADVFDLATILMLGLAGVSVTIGLQNLLPHYLSRLGMEISWAGRVGLILNVLNLVVLLVTVVFRASPASQQWAYATSVLVLLAGAAVAAAIDLARADTHRFVRRSLAIVASAGAVFLLSMTALTVVINPSGLVIAAAFLLAILVSSIVSRWIRSTELRFQGFAFEDERARLRWSELRGLGPLVLVPHRPGLLTLAERHAQLQSDYLLAGSARLIFVEAFLGDPSNFYQRPLMTIEHEEGLEVIRVSRCVSVSHVLAALCLELGRDARIPPQIVFGWSNEPPLAANLNFLLLGEGNIPWMVKELVRRAVADPARQPRVVIG